MTDEGNQFHLAQLAPLDGVPLVSSITSEESKKLTPPLQLLLQQLEFFNMSSVRLPSDEKTKFPPNAVGMRCQNCVSNTNGCGYVQLTSIKSLPSDLLAMASDHLIYCKCTKPDVRNKLKECNLLGLGFSPLTKYCELIAKVYGLEDSTNNDTQVVVWGDCPSIPSGYVGNPQHINIDFALRVDTVDEVVSKESVFVGGSILTEKAK
jgi:hypothetical protein